MLFHFMESYLFPKPGKCYEDKMANIPDSFLDELVSKNDIYDVVSGYVRLTKRSGSNVFGLCPFHNEKTPSFSVNTDKQIYYCFGCQLGGNVINFVKEIDNVSYRDAVEILAARVGMIVPSSNIDNELAEKRKRMLELNRSAARFFHELLSSKLAGSARDYLSKRGISKAMVTRFGIGVAPESWNLLVDSMITKNYTQDELVEAGLAKQRQQKPGSSGGIYDVFRNRLMFPVIDVRGNVLGFSGRILDNGEPKYLNSRDTLVFNKKRNLFGLNLAKKTKSDTLILVEGNIDVVTLHQAGFDNAVASLGTALTTEQAQLMSRHVNNVAIAYDSDESGRKAILRAIPILERTGMNVSVIDLGTSSDPDDFIKKNSPDAFKLLLERSEDHIEYQLLTIKNKHNMTTDAGRLSYLTSATELLSNLSGAPEREVYGAKVAEIAGVSVEAVKTEVNKKLNIKKAKQKKNFEQKVSRPTVAVQPQDRSLRYTNEYSALAEEGIIRSLIRDPSLMNIIIETGFSKDDFTSDFLSKIFNILSVRIADNKDTNAALVMAELENNEASHLTMILQKPDGKQNSEKIIREYIDKIKTEQFKQRQPDESTLLELKRLRERKDKNGR